MKAENCLKDVMNLQKTIYLVRHCEAKGQEREASLTEKGLIQAKNLKILFKDKEIHKVISSPFVRAIDSITPTARVLDLPIQQDERLSERILSTKNLFDWKEKLARTFYDFDLSFFGGESSSEAALRIRQVVDEVTYNTPTIIVTHGNILTLLLHTFDSSFGFHEWEKLTNPDVFKLVIKKDCFILKRLYNE